MSLFSRSDGYGSSVPADLPSERPTAVKLTRRALVASAGGAAVGAGAAVAADHLGTRSAGTGADAVAVPFYGPHQAGIGTPTQNFIQLAAFDFQGGSVADLRDLLQRWTVSAAALTRGKPVGGERRVDQPPADPGEAVGLGPSALTITFGLGATLFEQNGRDRLGLRDRQPSELQRLPPFTGESLDPRRSDGDLCVQACADDAQVAFHAVHTLGRLAASTATLRWMQGGFGRASTTSRNQATPRMLLGFKDGTNNIDAEDEAAMGRYVWVSAGVAPGWMAGGTYMVVRRIRILFDVWDATTLEQQERVIGRHKVSGAPLGRANEHDPVDLRQERDGEPVIPADAHIRVASPENNKSERILRRAYSYSDGFDPATGQLDAGLAFIAFQRSPSDQFIRIQQRLAASDALNHHTIHTASAMFAVPPGASRGGYVGETLL